MWGNWHPWILWVSIFNLSYVCCYIAIHCPPNCNFLSYSSLGWFAQTFAQIVIRCRTWVTWSVCHSRRCSSVCPHLCRWLCGSPACNHQLKMTTLLKSPPYIDEVLCSSENYVLDGWSPGMFCSQWLPTDLQWGIRGFIEKVLWTCRCYKNRYCQVQSWMSKLFLWFTKLQAKCAFSLTLFSLSLSFSEGGNLFALW
jgi:hypothetical protein